MAEDENFWKLNGGALAGSVAQASELPQSPLQLDTSLSTSDELQLEPAVDIIKADSQILGSVSSGSSNVPTVLPTATAPMLIPNSNRSMSSIHTQAKAAPADPHTTKTDVESQLLSSSGSSSINDLAEHVQAQSSSLPNDDEQPPSTPTSQTTGTFFNSMLSAATSSLQFNRTKTAGLDSVMDSDSTVIIRSPVDSNADDIEKITSSPNMLSYRRNKTKSRARRNTSLSSVELPQSPLAEAEKPYVEGAFDATLYVEEKFKDTNYHYATETRNEAFHSLFKSIPADERLIDDFSCALSREILLQGRMYISEHNICFNSNLLGWVTTLVIPFADINGFEKTVTAGLFPNGIGVSSKDGLKSFASFISRDAAYQFITVVFKASGEKNKGSSIVNGPHFISLNGPLVLTKQMDTSSDDDVAYKAAMLSIDGDSPMKRNISDTSNSGDDDDDNDDDDDDDDNDDDESDSAGSSLAETKTSNQSVYKLKEASKYSYTGELAHGVTRCSHEPEENKETVLSRVNLKCAPGILYEFLFGKNTDMIIEFLTSQDSREFSEISDYESNDEGLKERHYDYIKALNYSVGPKQTKCVVKETINHLNYSGYINVVNTTQTPDVPSGGSFCVKTRYIMTWGPNNTTDLTVSYWVHWMGSSWMKAVIEKSTKSGQMSAILALVEIIKKTIDNNVEEKMETIQLTASTESQDEEEVGKPSAAVTPVKAPTVSGAAAGPSLPFTTFNYIVIALLSVIICLQFRILQVIHVIPSATSSITSTLMLGKDTNDLLFRGEEAIIWSWIDERAGKLDLTRTEKVKIIQKDLDALLDKWTNGELNSDEGHIAMKEFEKSLNDYAQMSKADERAQLKIDALKKAIGALI